MKKNLKQFIRPDIVEMEEYIPVRSVVDLGEDYIKLDASENQFGVSPKIKEAIANTVTFNYYPDAQYKRLRKAISKYAGVNAKSVMVGCGSDELLDLVLRLILCDGDKIINCPPTFGMYPFLIKLNKGIEVCVPRKKDFSLDVTQILKKLDLKTKAIIICSPNNPTGNIAPEEEIITLLKSDKLVIVDEAYFEFCKKTSLSLLSKYNNLIVIRTFSKWAGIAGLRLGYVIANSFIISQILKIKQPYNVNLAAEIAGLTILNNIKTPKKNVQKIISERKRTYKALQKISNLRVYPTDASFILVKVNNNSLLKLQNYLENNKISIRYYNSKSTGQAIRISIGTARQNNKVIKSIKEFYEKN